MANILPKDKQLTALHLLTEGNSIRSTERITGVHRDTLCRLVVTFGTKCAEFLDSQLRCLSLRHVECDEIWTYVGKKQSRLTVDEKAEVADRGDVYLFTGIDQDTKLCAAHLLGKRTADNARRFMTKLAGRLTFPNAHQSDSHGYATPGYKTIIQLSTDGFPGYPEAVDLAFGAYAKFGTIIKEYKNATMNYTPSEMVGTLRRPVYSMRDGEAKTICTSHVERNNGTIRLFMKRYNRLTLCFSKKLENLEAAVAMHMANYNFCWRTRYPDGSGRPGKFRPTAAMMAGLTPTIWTFADLFGRVMG